MNTNFKTSILITTLATSLLVLAGCTTQTATNTNTANDNTNVVVTNSNENTNEVVNENTNTEQGSEVDTSGWLTYTNEEYEFSFKYPSYIYPNYTSQDKLPISRISVADAPKERTDDNPFLEYTNGELLTERDEISSAVVDNKTYILLDDELIAKVILKRVEGGAIVKAYHWYDDQYQYSIKFIFPVDKEMEDDFKSQYHTSDEVAQFMESIEDGQAPEKFQSVFDTFEDAMDTFRII
jgi:uncharacterized protein YcfL